MHQVWDLVVWDRPYHLKMSIFLFPSGVGLQALKCGGSFEDAFPPLQVSASKRVAAEDLDAAVEVLLRKSKGQLIYAKYAVDYMGFKVWMMCRVTGVVG